MKHLYVSALGLAVALCCVPAFAQHGHGAAGGAGMGAASHASPNANGTTAGSSGSSLASSHGPAMDQVLSHNTKLAGTIATLTGQSATDACAKFKNLGQCIAAAHVSNNLGITFACLKDDMLGTPAAKESGCPAGTGSTKLNLGRSIQALRPTADSKTESRKAEKQADQDMKDSSSNS